MRFKKCFKKAPTRRKQVLIPLPGGSRTGSHYQELFEQETIVRTQVEAIVRIFVRNVIGLKIEFKIEQLFDFFRNS